MKFRKFLLKKGVLGTALGMLKIIVENANPNVVFIGLVILVIFWIGFNCHFKCEQLKSEVQLEITRLELKAEMKIRKMELEAETRQLEQKKRKNKKGR